MQNDWTIPGTVLTIPRQEAQYISQRFSSMFLGGGIVLSQVAGITGLESYTIQNWVKRGFLTPPQRKRYSLEQLCRIISINMLKSVLPMERICSLLSYVNGQLDNDADDIIDDTQLYFMFVRLAANARQLDDPAQADVLLDEALADYVEPVPGARDRVKSALRVMLIGWLAVRMKQGAEEMLNSMGC